jgi:FtsZ-binding cell division protein ZapB
MLYYCVEHASPAELRQAYTQLQAEAEVQLAALRNNAVQSLLAIEARLTELTREVDTLGQEKEAIERQRAALARENQALRDEVQRLKLQGPRPTHRRGPNDDPYAVLHLTRNAPPEVVMAAYRALSKRDHPDVGGSDAAMQRLNWARDMILQRNEHSQ